LISNLRRGAIDGAYGKFENRVGRKAGGDSPWLEIANHAFDAVLAIEIDQVEREFHEEHVHGFAGHDPEAVTIVEPVMFEQSGAALGAGFGGSNKIADHGSAGGIAHSILQAHFLARKME
jgi:hypothetical protein